MRSRARRPVVALFALLLGLGVVGGPVTAPAGAAEHEPGFVRAPAVLATDVDLTAYDTATTRKGTHVVGWISSPTGTADRRLWVCTFFELAGECGGDGSHSFGPGLGGASSAKSLRVLRAGDTTRLVWFRDTPDSVSGPDNAVITTALLNEQGTSIVESSERAAPSFGSMLTAENGPGGVWTLAQAASGTGIQVVKGDGAATTPIATPWRVGTARLAFDGQTPVVVFDKYGAISEPLRVTRYVGGAWQASTRVPGTWTVGGAFDVETARGTVYLVSTVNNASYRPQLAAWGGRAFGRHRPTGNTASCHASTHDLGTDGSGRLADVSRQCRQLALANHPQRGASAIVREPIGGTPSADLAPQLSTRADGLGALVYSRSRPAGDVLLLNLVRSPALLRTLVGARSAGGRATVRGPVSCMPRSSTTVAVGARPYRGWRVVSRELTRNGRAQGRVLDGWWLDPGERFRLVGTVVFAKGAQRATARAVLTFTACQDL